MALVQFTHAEWVAEAQRRFGVDPMEWEFVCPSCGHVAKVKEWDEAGAPDGAAAFSCIGRYTGSTKTMGDKTGGPCNYTSGGLFNISPVQIKFGDDADTIRVFNFAEAR